MPSSVKWRTERQVSDVVGSVARPCGAVLRVATVAGLLICLAAHVEAQQPVSPGRPPAVATVGTVASTALQPGGVVSEALQTVGGVANTALQPGGVVSGLVGVVGNTLQNVSQLELVRSLVNQPGATK